MLALGICSRYVDGSTGGTRGAIDAGMAKKEWDAVRALGLLNEAGLLGPDLQLVHPLNTEAADWAALAKHGTHYSTSPLGEAARSGEMQFIEMMQAGVPAQSVETLKAKAKWS
jgi:cytosine/adenosine deaminase-related metal-dependent hydrolase